VSFFIDLYLQLHLKEYVIMIRCLTLIVLLLPSDAASLVALGFDDVQSLKEDVTENDLVVGGLKLGHARRVIRGAGGFKGQREAQ